MGDDGKATRGSSPGFDDTAPIPDTGMAVDADPLIGRTLVDRFLIEKRLGEGGMGAVYLAKHTMLEKPVALKVLHGEYSRKKDLVERFLQEAKAASKIRHENVIDITDFGATPDGYVFFAMELLDGRDLHEELSRAKLDGEVLPWDRTRAIFLQICAALEAAHDAGIVHRDLKPENIYLVEWYGHPDFVKLLDFGIAKMTEVGSEGRKLTKTGMLFGTPEYMSPEQARGDKTDHRVDIYAMGCILHQMVLGEVPFDAENFMGILTRHLSEQVPEITPDRLAPSAAPAGLAPVIYRALAKNPDQRFQTIKELADAVRTVGGRAAAAGGPERAPTGGRKRTQWTGSLSLPEPDTVDQPRTGGRAGLIIGGAALLALALGGGAYMMTRGDDGTRAGAAAAEPDAGAEGSLAAAGDVDGAATQVGGGDEKPSEVTVTIESTPAGAEVRDANGRVHGVTPYTYAAPVDSPEDTFSLYLDRHQPVQFQVQYDRDGTYDHRLKKVGRRAAGMKPKAVVVDRTEGRGGGDSKPADPKKPGRDPSGDGAQGGRGERGTGKPDHEGGDRNPPASEDGDKKKTDDPAKCDPRVNPDCKRLKGFEFPPG